MLVPRKLAAYLLLQLCTIKTLGQTTLDPSQCIQGSGITAFPNCNYVHDTLNTCDGPSVAPGADTVACYCNQVLLNAYFGCESEERLCFGGDQTDGSIQADIDQWHSICDERITFTPTTPPISSITVSNNADFCTTVFSACANGEEQDSQCKSSYTGSQLSSCVCEPNKLSLEYTCGFLGNTSCLQTPATLTNLAYYGFCSNFLEVLGGEVSAPASTPASTTSAVSLPSGSETSSSGSDTSSSSASVSSGTISITRPSVPDISPTQSPTSTVVKGAATSRLDFSSSTFLAIVFLAFIVMAL